MHWCRSFIIYFTTAITAIVMVHLTETISDKRSLNNIRDLPIPMNEHQVTNKTTENQILEEGFILLSNSRKGSQPLTPTSNDSSEDIRNSISHGTPSTTCKTTTVLDARDRHRKSINEPSDNVDESLSFNLGEIDSQLSNNAATIDGSGDTSEPTSETSTDTTTQSTTTSTSAPPITNSTTAPTQIVLSGNSTFLIIVNFTDVIAILTNISNELSQRFSWPATLIYDNRTFESRQSSVNIVQFTVSTSNNITVLNTLFQTLESIVSGLGIELESLNRCGTGERVVVKNVTSCYLIDLCGLCGTNPRRGICLPERNVSRCQCFVDEANPSVFYVDEFCQIPREENTTSTSASWAPIVIGILAGVAGLLCAITSCLLARFCYRRRRSEKRSHVEPRPSSLPRARMPTSDDISSREVDQNTAGNSRDMLAGVPSDIPSISSCYDPIDELDAIFDHEDIDISFPQSPRFEAVNPNFRLSELYNPTQ